MLASRSANFSAWRRWTLPLTAVAVPATTAVRATPLSSPGIVFLLEWSGSVGELERLEGLAHDRRRDPLAGDDLATAVQRCSDERHGPAVLVNDQRGNGIRLHRRSGLR